MHLSFELGILDARECKPILSSSSFESAEEYENYWKHYIQYRALLDSSSNIKTAFSIQNDTMKKWYEMWYEIGLQAY